MPSSPQDWIGHQLGGYTILRQIGAGGMAQVFLAEQSSMNRKVAIKVLPAVFLQDDTFLKRFYREVEIIAALEHPRILPVHDFGEQDGTPYIVMRYLSGGTITDLIRAHPEGMPLDRVVMLAEQIAEGLDYAHRRGIIHRDFKPSNVLLDGEGNAYLADFGIAKATADTASLTGTGIVGTPNYMAPEIGQLAEPDHLVDIYALGITVFQMLTGSLPFRATTPMGILMAHATEPIPDIGEIRPDLPAAIGEAMARACAKDRAKRAQSAAEVARLLREAASGADAAAPADLNARTTDEHPQVTPVFAESAPASAPVPARPAPMMPPPAAQQAPVAAAAPPSKKKKKVKVSGCLIAGLAFGGLAAIGLIIGVLLGGQFLLNGSTSDGGDAAADVRIEALETQLADADTAEQATRIAGEISDAGGSTGAEATAPPAFTAAPTPTATVAVSSDRIAFADVARNDNWEPVSRTLRGRRMVLVPTGCFDMGGTIYDDERPIHSQCIETPFWLDQYEVTIAQFGGDSADQHPVQRVNWYAAVSYCESQGLRLPTEAEWEYAVRGPSNLTYPWGDSFRSSLPVWDANAPGTSEEIGSRDNASWVGAYDLIGNVYEWVNSIYRPYPYDAADGREAATGSGDRVLRGGSWATTNEESLRGAFRFNSAPDGEYNGIGFRCARDYVAGDLDG